MNNLNIKRDIFLVVLSFLIAFLIVQTGAVEYVLTKTGKFIFIGSFIAGFFYVFAFTFASAIAVLWVIFQSTTNLGGVLEISLLAALGAVLGDFLIFRFFRGFKALQFEALFAKINPEKIKSWFHYGLAWIVPIIGAVVIASPLPDEIGLALLGFSRFPSWLLVPLAFVLNFFGILIFGLIAKQF